MVVLSESKLEDYAIELLKKDDIDEFLELMNNCFTESIERQRINFEEVRKIFTRLFKPVTRGILRILGVRFYCYIIRDNGNMISATTLYVARKKGIIGNVMTLPNYRRRGLAKKLFRHAVSEGERYNLEKLTLDVHAKNTGAIKLYENEGFVENYHSGTADIDLPITKLKETKDFAKATIVTEIDKEILEKQIDYCFPASYFIIRKRESLAKNYVPSKFAKIAAKKFAGQQYSVFSLSFNEELKPDGYIRADTSRMEEGISLSSPMVSKDDEKKVLYCLSQIVEQVDPTAKSIRISASMHRSDLFKSLQKIGFKIVDESLYMHKFLEKK